MISLRPYQERDVALIRGALRTHRRVLYQAPTGSGKGCCIAFMVAGAAAKGKRCCVVVHRRELVRDLSGRLDGAGVAHAVIDAGSRPARAPAYVASVQTLARRLDHYRDEFDFLIVDEAHHCLPENTWGKVLAAYPSAKVVGFTATPERLDGRGLGDSFDHLVIGPTVRELIEGGYLAPYRAYVPPGGGPDLSRVKTRMGDYDQRELGQAMSEAKLVGDAVEHYRKLADGLPAVAFCVSVEHARLVADAFAGAGYRAASVDGTMADEDREARITGLADGRVQVLTSCELISEGLDIPGIGAAILLRPTQSLAMALQQIGRALRPKPDGSPAVILDHAGNLHRHGLPDDPREWSLTSKRRKAKKPSKVPVKTCESCFAVVPSHVKSCPSCGEPFQGMPRELPEAAPGELAEAKSRFWDAEGRPVVPRSRAEIDAAVRSCTSWDELIELRRSLGFKPGWERHAARAAGWRGLGKGYATRYIPHTQPGADR